MENQVIHTLEEFQEVVKTNDEFYLLKHSLTCPISAAADQQYELFARQSKTPCYKLYVQEARGLSNHIAEVYGVRHESPQVLQFTYGKVKWHESHGAITQDRLSQI